MKWKDWLEKWNMTSLKINAGFLEVDWEPSDPDKNAAWDLYIELLTRIATQNLDETNGDENAALKSVYSLFPTTRSIIRQYGRGCFEFTKIAIVVLNQIVRPFTSKWHKILETEGLDDNEMKAEFRQELTDIQFTLRIYTQMLADMAGVENLTELEE